MPTHERAMRLSLNEGQAYVVFTSPRGLGCLPAHAFNDRINPLEHVATYYDGVKVEG